MKRLRWIILCDGLKRSQQDDGTFIDCATVKAHYANGHKYSRWMPGAGPGGCAGCVGFGDTLQSVQTPVPLAGEEEGEK